MKGQAIAFCAGLALAWCGTAEAQTDSLIIRGNQIIAPPEAIIVPGNSRPEDAAKVEIDDLKDRVKELEGLLKALLSFLPECSGEPPEKMPCIEKGLDEND
jgi:hypothetical protein